MESVYASVDYLPVLVILRCFASDAVSSDDWVPTV